jgi:hypothetical protein
MESDLRDIIARWRRIVITGTLTAYNDTSHTATVLIAGVSYPGIPVSYGIAPYAAVAGANVQATAGVMSFNSALPSVGCVVYIVSPTPPPDPFGPVTGHKHRGLPGDGPTL